MLNINFYKNLYNGELVDFIKITVPGDKTLTIDTLASIYTDIYPKEYSDYLAFNNIAHGTPLEEFTDLPKELIAELSYQGFRYIEQLATAGDNSFRSIMGGAGWRTKAQAFLDRGKLSYEDVVKSLSARIAELEAKGANPPTPPKPTPTAKSATDNQG